MKFILLILAASCTLHMLNAQAPVKATSSKTAASVPASKTKEATFLLGGVYSAPTGIKILLQNNGKNDLSLTGGKESGKSFSTSTFSFPQPLADGMKYKISAKQIPAGQTFAIYAGGDGIMPQGDARVKIGIDYSYDLVSRSSNDRGFSSFYESADAAIGGSPGEEGRYIAFVSSAAGFSGSTGKHRQIFWRDRNTGETKLISSGIDGPEGNADSYAPAISGDGISVAFESFSSNLVATDKNGFRDVFVWNAVTNKIERICVGQGGKEPNAESYEPSVSGDGNLIAFTSAAGNLTTTEKGVSNNNVFLFDMQSKTTVMVSVDPMAQKGGGGSKASISYDGSRIAFYSHTATLVANDKNGIWDIFLWEKGKPALKRISMTADGKERNQGTESANRIVSPSISGNGRYIAFTTTASNMVPGDVNNYQDVFVYDVNTGTTVIASNGANGQAGNADTPIEQGEKVAISFDGNWIAFSTNASNIGVPSANIVMRNMATAQNRAVSNVPGSSVGRPSISYTGGYVIFGIGAKLDSRFASSGLFASYTGVGLCRSCPQ